MNKLNIAVLFGGCSPEYNVSLESAYAVITHLDRNKYNPVLIGITETGSWFRFSGKYKKIKDNTWCNPFDCIRAVISPDREVHGLLEFMHGSVKETRIDAAFPVMHGKNGEDGTVQGLLELAGIPIVGCNAFSSAVCMDKDRAHKLAYAAGIKVPKAYVHNSNTDIKMIFTHAEKLGFPLFIKPLRAGSSFGITKVIQKNELKEAVTLALEHDSKIIIEENINGIEIGCAVLGNENLVTGQLDEIELSNGFFNHREKYTLETSSIHLPARITAQKTEEIKNAAKTIYKTLGCTDFARVDSFLTPSGEIIFNEVNTIPGFTLNSRYPKMLKAAGISFDQFINSAVSTAVNT